MNVQYFILPDIMGLEGTVYQRTCWAENRIWGGTETLTLIITMFYGINVNVKISGKWYITLSVSVCLNFLMLLSSITYQGPSVQGDPVLSVDLGLLGEREVGLEARARPDYQSCHLAFQGVKSSKVTMELKM